MYFTLHYTNLGVFYKEELSKTVPEKDKKLIIKDVLKSRTRKGKTEYLVKLEGEDGEYWIKEEEIL